MRKPSRNFFISIIAVCTLCTAADAGDVWSIDADNIDPKNYYGETLANGMIGIRSTAEPLRTGQILIAGAWETLSTPTAPSSTVEVINFLNMNLLLDGEKVDTAIIARMSQKMDFKNAVLTSTFSFKDKATISTQLRALRNMPYSGLLEVTVTPRRAMTLSATTRLDAPASLVDVKTYASAINLREAPDSPLRFWIGAAKTAFGRHTVGAAQSFLFDEPYPAKTQVKADNGLTFSKQLPAGKPFRFALVGASLTSAHNNDPMNEAQRLTAFAVMQGAPWLVARHNKEWADLWKSGIHIEGDDATQRDVNSMLYHLYSQVREGTNFSIAPMGITEGPYGYLGHIFWDAEIWMFPTLLALHPPLAKNLLEYRFERLPAARRNAAAHGFRGAKFPWESAATGDEDIWSTAIGTIEYHITADVGIAAWNYYRVTQDKEWLRENGYPLIKETADFWTSLVERNGPGRYDINNVVAADEYAENVDNNAFTNGAAKVNLAAATAAAKVLGLTPDPDWEVVRENIPILKFPNGVTREHATFDGHAAKQADVNLLAYPLKLIADPKDIERDLEYYARYIDDVLGPAMTKSIFALLYQRLGQSDKALKMFHNGIDPLERPPFGVLAENSQARSPYFVTGAGGLLQTLLYGFGGLDITDEGLTQFSTKLPKGWKSITITGAGPERKTFVVK